MTSLGWGAIVVAFVAAVGSVLVAAIGRSSNRLTANNSAGELALKLAQEARKETDELRTKVTSLETWQRTVRAAWREHETWDDLILDRLEVIAPGTRATMPPRPPLPID